MTAQKELVMNFYNGKSILITGGTGSLGKMVLEKLLRSCWGLENVYLLVRPKKGQTAEQRITDMLNVPLYDELKKSSPEVFTKIIMIEGDLSCPDLGLSHSSKKVLIEKISIVFHCAATVSFKQTLKQAISINVCGTRELVLLCKRMSKLEAFLHVSTLFSNCPEESIEERIYPLRSGLDGSIDYNKLSAKEIAEKIPEEWLKLWPNTYTLSKSIAENYLNQEKDNLPISIIRPSIVLSTLNEPIRGWIDNLYGPTVIVCNSAKGILRAMLCDLDTISHIVPSDIVVNMMICIASRTKKKSSHDIDVYNCCTSRSNSLKWGKFGSLYGHYIKVHPMNDIIWYPDTRYYSSYWIYRFFYILQHYLPAYIIDFLTKIGGGTVRLVRIYDSIHNIIMKLEPFDARDWSVSDDNSRSLIEKLSEKDRTIFPFDVGEINWDKYCEDYVKGIKLYLFKESFDNIDAARARVNKFFWIEKALQCFVIGVIAYFIYCWF